jgi:hypothetical protein
MAADTTAAILVKPLAADVNSVRAFGRTAVTVVMPTRSQVSSGDTHRWVPATSSFAARNDSPRTTIGGGTTARAS